MQDLEAFSLHFQSGQDQETGQAHVGWVGCGSCFCDLPLFCAAAATVLVHWAIPALAGRHPAVILCFHRPHARGTPEGPAFDFGDVSKGEKRLQCVCSAFHPTWNRLSIIGAQCLASRSVLGTQTPGFLTRAVHCAHGLMHHRRLCGQEIQSLRNQSKLEEDLETNCVCTFHSLA